MYGFLKHYNNQDVQPLANAITKCFKAYREYFGVRPYTSLSLSSLAQDAMFQNFCDQSPYIYSFADAQKDINLLFRANVYGGIVNVYKRHVRTFDSDDNVPDTARHAPNGDPYTGIITLDFTSMYLTTQKMNMPTTQGIDWKLKGRKYSKSIMTSGHSFKAQQWLCYREATGKIENLL